MRQHLTFILLVSTMVLATKLAFAQKPKAYWSFNVNAAIDSLAEKVLNHLLKFV